MTASGMGNSSMGRTQNTPKGGPAEQGGGQGARLESQALFVPDLGAATFVGGDGTAAGAGDCLCQPAPGGGGG